jgi:predicted TIM-barrel fold metal-dependent hydrolase
VDTLLIDAHVHLYRDIEAEKRGLPIPGRRDRDRWGNPDSVVAYMDREGVSHALSLNIFPTAWVRRGLRARIADDVSGAEREDAYAAIEKDLAERLRNHNGWLCALSRKEPRILAGIGIQKLLTPEEMVAEVNDRSAQGARAVKMIPGWYREFPSDRAFWPMYACCAERGLPVVADTGRLGLGYHAAYPGEYNEICYGEPARFEEVLAAFPGLTLVMAHFGSAFWDERIDLAGRYANLMFDISGGFHAEGFKARDGQLALSETEAVRVMRKIGMERFMFGSDGPHAMLQPYLEQILRLDLSEGERQVLLNDNARRVYRIED